MSLNRNQKLVREDYLRFIRSRPCVACGVSGVDASHVKARGTYEHKRIDFLSLPACRSHHQEQERKGWEAVEAKYKFNRNEEMVWCLIEFFLDQERQMERIA